MSSRPHEHPSPHPGARRAAALALIALLLATPALALGRARRGADGCGTELLAAACCCAPAPAPELVPSGCCAAEAAGVPAPGEPSSADAHLDVHHARCDCVEPVDGSAATDLTCALAAQDDGALGHALRLVSARAAPLAPHAASSAPPDRPPAAYRAAAEAPPGVAAPRACLRLALARLGVARL